MDVHQTEFLQAVVLAGAVALGMTVWDVAREETPAQAAGIPPRTGVTPTGVKNPYIVAATRKGEVQP